MTRDLHTSNPSAAAAYERRHGHHTHDPADDRPDPAGLAEDDDQLAAWYRAQAQQAATERWGTT
jgi:hypothetical protein